MKITERTKEVMTKNTVPYTEIIFSPKEVETILLNHLKANGVTPKEFSTTFTVDSKYVCDDWGMSCHYRTDFKGVEFKIYDDKKEIE